MSSAAFSSGQDDLGIFVRISADTGVFSETAIYKTAYWFTDEYYLYLSKKQANLLEIEIRPKNSKTSVDNLKDVCGAFMNYMLDQEVRQKVIQETAAVRETLIQKAFFEAKATLPNKVVSDESNIPGWDQSYKDDPIGIGR